MGKRASGDSSGSRMGWEMGLDETTNMGIEGEKIGLASRWLGPPSMTSLDMPPLSFSRCPPKGFDLRRFLRDPFLRGFELYSLKGLLWNCKFKLFPKSTKQDHPHKKFQKVEFLLPLEDFGVLMVRDWQLNLRIGVVVIWLSKLSLLVREMIPSLPQGVHYEC